MVPETNTISPVMPQYQDNDISGYRWADAELNCSHAHLLPFVLSELKRMRETGTTGTVLDLGCGNGCVANVISELGWKVVGIDPSHEGIVQARGHFPHVSFYEGSAYDELVDQHGTFPIVVSLEVVEHVYYPRRYAEAVFSLLEPGGTAIISTPYHGYLKNLVLALSGKLDAHFTALWDHGHIKFWSVATLTELLREAGFAAIRFKRVGRVPILAKSMIAVVRKPEDS